MGDATCVILIAKSVMTIAMSTADKVLCASTIARLPMFMATSVAVVALVVTDVTQGITWITLCATPIAPRPGRATIVPMGQSSYVTYEESVVAARMCMRGIDATWKKNQSLTIAGETTTPAKLKATLQAEVDATGALLAAEAAVARCRRTCKAARAASKNVRMGIKRYIVAVHGKKAEPVLTSFGLPAPKSPPRRTVDQKVEAAMQARATRKLRGTMSKKAKSKIKAPPPVPAEVAAAIAGAKGSGA
jgi:hypothetical protein